MTQAAWVVERAEKRAARRAPLMQELEDNIREAGGVLRVEMERPRMACGWNRLSRGVAASISDKLDEHGIGHLPAEASELPLRADDLVWLYLKDSQVGRSIAGVLSPTAKSMSRLVRISNSQAAGKLRRIRQLVEELDEVLGA